MSTLRVPSLPLPERLPHPDAIRSVGDNRHGYEPEFWEFQYEIYRYLERVTEGCLIERYRNILRNMKVLISRDSDAIPIQFFLSSWYWFRKEHQTRLEFALRDVLLPLDPSDGVAYYHEVLGAPVRLKHPNVGAVLFRYDKRIHIEKIAREGIIRIRPASDFREMVHDRARNDEELSKKAFLPGAHTRITTKDGRKIPVLGNVERTVSMPDYYLFCMALDWHPVLFNDFGDADACIVVKDAELFARRMEMAASPHLPGLYFHHHAIQYFDPYEKGLKNEYFDAAMCKDFSFAYQREYRFIWFPQSGEVPDGFKLLELGSLGNMAEVHTSPGI